jgi:hypothetical protein
MTQNRAIWDERRRGKRATRRHELLDYQQFSQTRCDLRRANEKPKKEFRDHALHLELAIGHTDVTDPRAGFDDAAPIITRNERG